MYWYISFLRPPPVSAPISSECITITPQIANDLRTELLYDYTQLQLVWQKVSPTLGPVIESKEVISWSPPESTYRPLSIPLPAQAKVGESWRIGLHVEGSSSPRGDFLEYAADGKPTILGVWSEGISLVRGEPSSSSGPVRGVGGENANGKGKKKGKGVAKEEEGKKQGRITRDWALPKGSLVVVEQTSFDLDKKIWDSGLALGSWFWRYLDEKHSNKRARNVIKVLKKERPLRVLEIGSGTGLVAVALALALEHKVPEGKTEIVATDLESAIELMNENLELNGFGGKTKSAQVSARVLDWDQDLPPWVDGPWPDLIVAADVTYNTAAFPSLLSTFVALLQPASASEKKPTLVLAYKQRDAAERDLWNMLEQRGIVLEKVDTVAGAADEGTVEVWISL